MAIPDGQNRPLCFEHKGVKAAGGISMLLRAAGGLAGDPMHRIAGSRPDLLHAAMLHWLAWDRNCVAIWELAGLEQRSYGPDSSISAMNSHGMHVVLDESMGGRAALVQCCFKRFPDYAELAEMKSRGSAKIYSLGKREHVRWNLFTLADPTWLEGSSWSVITAGSVRRALNSGKSITDPAAEAYERYLGHLEAVSDAVRRMRQHGPVDLTVDEKRDLRRWKVLDTVCLAEALCA